MRELQALHAGAVRPPEGMCAAHEGLDGEIRGCRDYPLRMRDMDSPEGTLQQAPYNTSQDNVSNPRSLVQVSEQQHPVLQRPLPAKRTWEYRSNRARVEVVVVGGAAPDERSPVTQESHVRRGREHGTTWAGGEGEIMDILRGR